MRLPRVPVSLDDVLDPARAALIVWDMQNGIGAHAHNISSLLPALHSLIDSARDAGVLVVWSRHVGAPLALTDAPTLRYHMQRQGVNDPEQLSPFMQAGTPDAELMPELTPAEGEIVLEKSTRSLFIGTPLELRLRARDVQTIVLAGVATDQGIEVMARHAFALGFFAVVVEDAVGARTAEAHELGLAFLRRTQTEVVGVGAVLAAWTRAG